MTACEHSSFVDLCSLSIVCASFVTEVWIGCGWHWNDFQDLKAPPSWIACRTGCHVAHKLDNGKVVYL